MFNTHLKVIRKPEAICLAGLSRTSLYEQSRKGLFPKPISLGERAVGYLEHEVQTVIAARSVGKTDQELREIVKSLMKQREQSIHALLKFAKVKRGLYE
jgi:prophage regulatory protein